MMPLMHAWCSRNVVDSCYVPCAWLYWTCSTKITINAEIFISAPLAHPRDFNMQFPASFHDFTWPDPVSDRRILNEPCSGTPDTKAGLVLGVMRSAQDAFRLIKTSSAALGWPGNGDCRLVYHAHKKCSHIAIHGLRETINQLALTARKLRVTSTATPFVGMNWSY